MGEKTAQFRFYEELNDFLPQGKRKRPFLYAFSGKPGIKDAIEGIGVPHPEVDLIVVNGESVGFDYHLQDGDHVSVYPVFESLDISPVVRLRPSPLRETRFVLDGHLGKLARLLRMLGFDSLYSTDFEDSEIVRLSAEEKRVILTRDVELLKANAVTHGCWVRAISPNEQVREVLDRFDLYSQVQPFRRCMRCNSTITRVGKETVLQDLPDKVRELHDEFYRCAGCRKVYWKGSHYHDMMSQIQRLSNEAAEGGSG
jgi:uncharacterized protein with PIN domain